MNDGDQLRSVVQDPLQRGDGVIEPRQIGLSLADHPEGCEFVALHARDPGSLARPRTIERDHGWKGALAHLERVERIDGPVHRRTVEQRANRRRGGIGGDHRALQLAQRGGHIPDPQAGPAIQHELPATAAPVSAGNRIEPAHEQIDPRVPVEFAHPLTRQLDHTVPRACLDEVVDGIRERGERVGLLQPRVGCARMQLLEALRLMAGQVPAESLANDGVVPVCAIAQPRDERRAAPDILDDSERDGVP